MSLLCLSKTSINQALPTETEEEGNQISQVPSVQFLIQKPGNKLICVEKTEKFWMSKI